MSQTEGTTVTVVDRFNAGDKFVWVITFAGGLVARTMILRLAQKAQAALEAGQPVIPGYLHFAEQKTLTCLNLIGAKKEGA
jgi:hypothetical protein